MGLSRRRGGQLTKVKKTDGKTMRCVFLRLDNFDDEEGFQSIDDLQEELPFE